MHKEVKEFKKNLILKVASKHFKEKGYSETQIEKISKELNIGIGTIYSFFGSKEGLFTHYIHDIINNSFTEIKELVKEISSPIEKLKIIVEYKFSYYEKNKTIIKDYINSNLFFLKNAQRGKENPMKIIYKYVSEIIKDLLSEEKYKNSKIISSDYYHLAYAFDAIINSYIERYCEQDTDLRSKTPEAMQMFMNAIGV